MKNLKRIWSRIPRKLRAITNLVLITAFAMALYVFIDSPAFSEEVQYRREERANHVGPAQILDMLPLDSFYRYEKVLLADDGDGVILYQYDENRGDLTYRKKTGDITVLALPGDSFSTSEWQRQKSAEHPIFVFDDYPDAVRAELNITLSCEYNSENFQKAYTLEARRQSPGYFLFTLCVSNPNGLGAEGEALYQLSHISSDVAYGRFFDVAFPATVRLYDETDALVCERSVTIRTIAAEVRGEQNP